MIFLDQYSQIFCVKKQMLNQSLIWCLINRPITKFFVRFTIERWHHGQSPVTLIDANYTIKVVQENKFTSSERMNHQHSQIDDDSHQTLLFDNT